MEYKILNKDTKMPVIGYGVYQTPRNQTYDLVLEALNMGYRHIDTAQNYGNEKEVGEAIKNSGIEREEIFVTTKTQTNGYESTLRGIDNSLNEFGYDYFDLILIHWPNGDNVGTYHALGDALKDGKTKAIGLSNFNSQQFNTILENCHVKPSVNQIETHILWQQKKMHEFLNNNSCVHEAWSPFASGMMNIFNNEVLQDVATKHDKTTGQVMLRYLIQNDIVVIPKSTSTNRMKENIDLFDFNLDDDDLDNIARLDKRQSYCDWPMEMQKEAKY